MKKFENYGGLTDKDKFAMRSSLKMLESSRKQNLATIKEFLEDDIVFYLNKDRIFKEVKSKLDKKNIHFNNILDVMSKIPLASNGKKYLRLNKYMKIVYILNVIPESPINVVVDKQYLLSIADDVLIKEF